MCGVIGYIGLGAKPEFFYNGLKRLEYRGYDSAGIAMLTPKGVFIERAEGKLANLEKKLGKLPESATVGIGHTRWATHGRPTENNAHPHRSGVITLLHNGIIENYRSLKDALTKKGYNFSSETDTEVAAHLLHSLYTERATGTSAKERMKNALQMLVAELKGAFAFGILCEDTPDVLYAVKYGSPLVLGEGEGENYLASGITALVEHTRSVHILEDREFALLTKDAIELFDFEGMAVSRNPIKVEWSVAMMEKGGYRHFMLKEIYEHPQALAQVLGGRFERSTGKVSLKDYGVDKLDLTNVDRVQIIACGGSYYASMAARYFIESFAKIPVEVELASEYRYKAPTCNQRTLAVAVSQSGETADTLQAIKFAKANNAMTLAVVNVPGSTIAHACHAESLLHAGPEIGVASTKVFSAQIMSICLLGLCLAQSKKTATDAQITEALDEFVKVPSLIEKALGLSTQIEQLASKYTHFSSILYIGRGQQWAIALEGALKIKELSYIHAEGYAGGELKHGPIALIDESMPVVCIAVKDAYYEKTISNIEEIKARGGHILAIGVEGDEELQSLSHDFIGIPESSSIVAPFLTTIPMHLFAYWVAVRKGTDVDQPRNLAKSVTVE